MRHAATKLIVLLLLCLSGNRASSAPFSFPMNPSAPITEHYAEVNGGRLHYAQAGRGKKLLLFVHGFPEFWYKYRAQLE